jgi:hypothetical protein
MTCRIIIPQSKMVITSVENLERFVFIIESNAEVVNIFYPFLLYRNLTVSRFFIFLWILHNR